MNESVWVQATDGARLAVWDGGGAGIPVVFAHGFPQTHLCWREVLQHLSAGSREYRLIAYDLRGFGESAKTGEASWQQQLSDHLDVVDGLGLKTYHVVGHDWGGATALHMARFHPERLQSAVVLNTNYWRSDLRGMWHLFFLSAPLAASTAFRLAPETVYQLFLRSAYRNPERIDGAALEAYRNMFEDPETVRYWIRLYRSMARSLLRQATPEPIKRRWKPPPGPTRSSPDAFRIPIRLIWGSADTFNPLWIARDMVDRLRARGATVTLHPIDGAGHFVVEEQPEQVAALIEEHLAR